MAVWIASRGLGASDSLTFTIYSVFNPISPTVRKRERS